jgi:hypothetical protein
MGRTALYRDPIPFHSARAELQLDADRLVLRMPDGRLRHHELHGYVAATLDGFVRTPHRRHFVRMLDLERGHERLAVITPPEHGAVAPNVVRIPEAPADAAIVEPGVWEVLADWMLSGGRLAACTIEDLARLVVIATTQFAMLIGEVAAERALELAWGARGPLRSAGDLESSLRPLACAATDSPRAAEALVSAHAHAAGATRRRRKLW